MKSKLLIFTLASAALLASCSSPATSSSPSASASSSEPTYDSYSSQWNEEVFHYTLSRLLTANESGDLVPSSIATEVGLQLSFTTAEGSTKPSIDGNNIVMPAGNTFTLTLTNAGETLMNGLEKNALGFASAVAAGSLTATHATVALSSDGLTAELTVEDGTKTYSVATSSDVQLSTLVVVTRS